jgi:chromosome segregation ATPase
MDVAWLGWVVGLVGAGAGLYFAQRERSSSDLLRGRVQQLEAALSERDQALAAAQQKAAQQRERAEEIAELRQRVEKLKQRAKQAADEHKVEPERLQALQGQLAQARRDVEAARRCQEEARRELLRAEALRAEECGRLEAKLEAARRGEEVEALRRRAETAEALASQLEARALKAAADAERFQRRWESVDRAYMVLRGEKAALEDELRTKTERIERLEALKVALIDAPAESPRESA